MSIRMIGPGAAAALAFALAGAAQAQDAGTAVAALSPQRLLAAAVVGPANAEPGRSMSLFRTASSSQSPASDVSRTEVDHRFAASGLTGSLGYLCGLDNYPHGDHEIGGPASSYGRESTFLGAKLSYAFH